ncbi:MAG: polymerase IV-like protein ImuB [Myxococcaceae bacterium]|nr:polymerase IV-like protein ImuB [Myxococcaceae bacterium]
MRIAAISLPDLHVEVVRANARANAGAKTTAVDPELHAHAQADAAGVRVGMPLAIVVAPAPLTEAKLLGNTRLDVVSREARALGVQPGQTIAQARARAANLAVRVVRPEAVQGVLARLAEVSLAFGATVSFSFSNAGASAKDAKDGKGRDAGASASHGDVVWVDVTGCAHLHAPRERDRTAAATANDGEAILAARLASVFGGLGHSCAVAIADGPRVAAILARAAASARASASARAAASIRDGARPRPSDHRFEDDDPPLVVVPSGKNAIALAPLPVSALPIGADDARWLAKLGVRTIGELRALPRSALASRLGVRAPVIIGLAEGDDRAPLTSYVPPEIPEEETTLEYGVEGSEALTFVAKTLSDRLATRLAGRAVAASRIELDLVLDVALLGDHRDAGQSRVERVERVERVDRIQRIAIELPAPLSSASDLLAALRPKIERAVLRAPVLAAKLRAASLVHKPQAALSLFESQPKAERALPRLVAELAADLGEEAVGKLALGDAWLPADRSRFVRLEMKATSSASASATRTTRPRRHMLASVPEPTRILDVPVPVPRDAVKVVRHLSRLESVDWWKHLPGEGAKKGVDYVHAWVDEGAAWVEIDRATGAARVRGWFD